MEFKEIIECPYCHTQYLPGEIYFPVQFLGRPTNIIRDDDGKIEFASGEQMDLTETFTCEHCGCSFAVKGNISFKTTKLFDESEEDFTIELETRNTMAKVDLFGDN